MPSKRLLYTGLATGIFANIMVIVFEFQWGMYYAWPANFSAIIVSLAAAALIRWRAP